MIMINLLKIDGKMGSSGTGIDLEVMDGSKDVLGSPVMNEIFSVVMSITTTSKKYCVAS